MIGQRVCFQCPLTGSAFSWTFEDTDVLPVGAQGFANGTLVINSVAQVHLDPAFFRCVADGDQSDPYRLVEACELHAHMFPSSVLTIHLKASLGNICWSQHLTQMEVVLAYQKSPTLTVSLCVVNYVCVIHWTSSRMCYVLW